MVVSPLDFLSSPDEGIQSVASRADQENRQGDDSIEHGELLFLEGIQRMPQEKGGAHGEEHEKSSGAGEEAEGHQRASQGLGESGGPGKEEGGRKAQLADTFDEAFGRGQLAQAVGRGERESRDQP